MPTNIFARRLVSSLALAALWSCASPVSKPADQAQSVSAELISGGADIASARCGRCHATGTTGESPLPQAPAFRTLASRYRLDVLREEFQQGVHVGAAEMPKFDLSIADIDALSAYLASIQIPEENRPVSIK